MGGLVRDVVSTLGLPPSFLSGLLCDAAL